MGDTDALHVINERIQVAIVKFLVDLSETALKVASGPSFLNCPGHA